MDDGRDFEGYLRAEGEGAHPRSRPLSPRQLEVAFLLSHGFDAAMVAEELGITYNTARSHERAIRERTGAKNTAHALARLFRSGALPIDGTPPPRASS